MMISNWKKTFGFHGLCKIIWRFKSIASLYDQWFFFYFIMTDLHLFWIIPKRGDLNASLYQWIDHLNRVSLTFFMKLLISVCTVYQDTNTQLLPCCPSLTLTHVIVSNSGYAFKCIQHFQDFIDLRFLTFMCVFLVRFQPRCPQKFHGPRDNLRSIVGQFIIRPNVPHVWSYVGNQPVWTGEYGF